MPQVDMKKYLAIFNNSWQRQLTYRANMLAFRVGNLIEFTFQILIWLAIFASVDVVGGYDRHEMVTYVTLTWLFTFFTSTYGIEDHVSQHIRDGKLSEFLIKPISYLRYMTVLSLGRSSLPSFYGIFVIFAFMAIFRKMLVFPDSPWAVLLIIAILLVGILIRLLLSIMVGMISFWTNDVSGINYTINTIIRFFSGNFAPLNLLPKALYNFTLWTPFVYITYFPAQIYLGKVDAVRGVYGLMIEILWLFILYWLIKAIWHFGVRKYEASGN